MEDMKKAVELFRQAIREGQKEASDKLERVDMTVAFDADGKIAKDINGPIQIVFCHYPLRPL